MIKKIKILGYGEIGKSIHEIYKIKKDKLSNVDISYKDLNHSFGDYQCDLLHICIPYSDSFVENCIDEIGVSNPKYVIIHSTVYPGTTEYISTYIDSVIVHSPVIGVHPNLAEGILTFKKWVGITSGNYQPIIDHLNELDISTGVIKSIESETFKILDTTYYGLCLGFNAESKIIFETIGSDYSKWVDYLKNYNDGYDKLNMSNVSRPWFNELNMPIGGHCVKPNAELLNKLSHHVKTDDEISKFVLKWCK